MINVEARIIEEAPLSNINIVTRGGKKTRVDQGTPNKPTII